MIIEAIHRRTIMIKTMLNMFVGALVAASVGLALAVTGQPPVQGFQTPDGTWLLGLAGGQNYAYQYGITAHAGGGQTACQNLTPGFAMYQVDTVVTNADSICLPFAIAGTDLNLRNNTAQTLAMERLGARYIRADRFLLRTISNVSR
jgi:hypothetical protein